MRTTIAGFLALLLGSALFAHPAVAQRGSARPSAYLYEMKLIRAGSILPASDGEFKDSLIHGRVRAEGGSFYLELWNLTNGNLEIAWDRASFVGLDGVASRVVPDATRRVAIASSVQPSLLPPGAAFRGSVYPVDYVNSSARPGGGVYMRNFVCVGTNFEELRGRRASLVLSLVASGEDVGYTLVFEMGAITARNGLPKCGGPPQQQGDGRVEP